MSSKRRLNLYSCHLIFRFPLSSRLRPRFGAASWFRARLPPSIPPTWSLSAVRMYPECLHTRLRLSETASTSYASAINLRQAPRCLSWGVEKGGGRTILIFSLSFWRGCLGAATATRPAHARAGSHTNTLAQLHVCGCFFATFLAKRLSICLCSPGRLLFALCHWLLLSTAAFTHHPPTTSAASSSSLV